MGRLRTIVRSAPFFIPPDCLFIADCLFITDLCAPRICPFTAQALAPLACERVRCFVWPSRRPRHSHLPRSCVRWCNVRWEPHGAFASTGSSTSAGATESPRKTGSHGTRSDGKGSDGTTGTGDKSRIRTWKYTLGESATSAHDCHGGHRWIRLVVGTRHAAHPLISIATRSALTDLGSAPASRCKQTYEDCPSCFARSAEPPKQTVTVWNPINIEELTWCSNICSYRCGMLFACWLTTYKAR